MIETFDVLKAQEAIIKAIMISAFIGYHAPQTILWIALFWSVPASVYFYVLYKKYLSKKPIN